MSSPGLGLDGSPQSSLTSLVEQKLRAERVVKAGANWLITVAALSLINSVLAMSGSGFHFIFGLGIAELVDALPTKPVKAASRSTWSLTVSSPASLSFSGISPAKASNGHSSSAWRSMHLMDLSCSTSKTFSPLRFTGTACTEFTRG